MESQGFGLGQESNEELQLPKTIAPSPDALFSTFTSLSLDPPTPKTFNDLPDELMDDIAASLPRADLRSVALVERRLYEPARRATRWSAAGFADLMAFADVLLERPQLGVLVREADLSGAPGVAAQRRAQGEDSPLVGRAIAIIIEECPTVRTLVLRDIDPGSATEWDVLSAIAELQNLRQLSLPTNSTSLPAFQLIASTLPRLSSLNVGLSEAMDDAEASKLPASTISRLTVGVDGDAISSLRKILDSLACACRHLDLIVGDGDEHSFAELSTFLPPYIVNCTTFMLQITSSRELDDWRQIPLPTTSGWVCYQSTLHRESPRRVVTQLRLEVGEWLHLIASLILDAQAWIEGSHSMPTPRKLLVRRGPDWAPSQVTAVERLARRVGASLDWL